MWQKVPRHLFTPLLTRRIDYLPCQEVMKIELTRSICFVWLSIFILDWPLAEAGQISQEISEQDNFARDGKSEERRNGILDLSSSWGASEKDDSMPRRGKMVTEETKIFITSDSPTLHGTKTSFNVTIITPVNGSIFLSYYTYQPYRFFELETTVRFYRFSIKTWESTGTKLVYVRVKKKDSYGRMIVLGTNYTSVYISKFVQCKIKVWQNGSEITNKTVTLGNVTFVTTFHDPTGLFTHANVSTVWGVNDGTPLSSSDTASTDHLFEKEGLFTIQVLAFIYVGGKKYIGKGSAIVKVESRVKYELIVWQGIRNNEPRVPSRDQCIAVGPTFFFVRLIDPFKMLRSAKFVYHWKFEGGRGNKSNSNFTKHIFDTVGHKSVQVDVVAKLEGKEFPSSVRKVIRVQDPIHSILINGKKEVDKGDLVMFNVTCKGSPPVSFCWYITEGGCQLPQNVICSPTFIYKSCWSVFYHKFRYSGGFCVNVSVINTVSFVHTHMQVNVKGIPEVEKGHIVAIASTLPFVAVFLLIITVFLAIKHSKGMYYRRNKKRSETAKFDFRGSDASFDQWSVSGRCHRYVVCPDRPGCVWPCLRVEEEDIDDTEETRLFSDPSSPATPQRKTSYYGTIHMNLLQRNSNESSLEKDDPMSRENTLCHSV